MAEGLLLHTAPDLIESSGPELDDVERVEDCGSVLEFIIDRVLVAVERVQGRDLDAGTERFVTLLQPVRVGRSGPARDEIE